ncbi:MAG: hypothetical protein FJX21_13935 [Alphaproteobacteria bacterium]|nr:hypothetical protein [Alphaproteobacteria bacterium]
MPRSIASSDSLPRALPGGREERVGEGEIGSAGDTQRERASRIELHRSGRAQRSARRRGAERRLGVEARFAAGDVRVDA